MRRDGIYPGASADRPASPPKLRALLQEKKVFSAKKLHTIFDTSLMDSERSAFRLQVLFLWCCVLVFMQSIEPFLCTFVCCFAFRNCIKNTHHIHTHARTHTHAYTRTHTHQQTHTHTRIHTLSYTTSLSHASFTDSFIFLYLLCGLRRRSSS
jgi:hypothetical protein